MSSTHTFENVSNQIMQWIGVNQSEPAAQDGPVWADKGIELAYRDPNEELEEILSERLPEGNARDEMIMADAKHDDNDPRWEEEEEEEVSADSEEPTVAEEIVEGALEGGLTDPVTVGSILVGGAAIALAAGGGGGGSKYYGSSSGTEYSGVVADGYIRDAKLYVDENANGVAEDSEYVATSNSSGEFSFTTEKTGALIATGGTNVDTGLENNTVLKTAAPAEGETDSIVINPITTVVQELIEETGAGAADAEAEVQEALGIEGDIDLLTYDAIAEDNLEVQQVNAQIAAVSEVAEAGEDNLGANAMEAIAKGIDNDSFGDDAIDFTSETDLGIINAEIGETLVLQVDSTNGDIANDTLVGGNFTDMDIDKVTDATIPQAGTLNYDDLKAEMTTGDTIEFTYNGTAYTATLTDGINNLQADIDAATDASDAAIGADAVTASIDDDDNLVLVAAEGATLTAGEATDVDIVKARASIDTAAVTEEGAEAGAKVTYTGIENEMSTGDTIVFTYNGTEYTATLTNGTSNLQTDINNAIDSEGNALGAGLVTASLDDADMNIDADDLTTIAATATAIDAATTLDSTSEDSVSAAQEQYLGGFSVADAEGKTAGSYSLVDTTANLFAASEDDVMTGATDVTATDPSVTVEVWGQLTDLANTGSTSAFVVDSVANLTDEVADFSGAESVTAQLSSSTDLAEITLDSQVTAIDLNGQAATLSVAQGTLAISDTSSGGSGSATVELASDGSDADLTGVTLDSDVSAIDLNGQDATLTVSQGTLAITASGGAATVKLTAADANLADTTLNAGVTKIDLNGQAATLTVAQAGLEISDSDADDAGSYNIVDTAAALSAGTTYVVDEGSTVTAKVEENDTDLTDKTLDEAVTHIDLNGQEAVRLTIAQSNLNVSDSDADSAGSYDIVDTVTKLSEGADYTAHANGGVIATVESTDTDLIDNTLDSAVTGINLDGQDVMLTAAQAELEIVDYSSNQNGTATLKLTADDADLTDNTVAEGLTGIDLNGQAATLTVAQGARTLSDSGTGGTATVQLASDGSDADLTGVAFNSKVSAIDLNGQAATMTLAQFETFAGNVTKGTDGSLAVNVTATTDLTAKGLDSLVIDNSDDDTAITATMTVEQADTLAGNVTKGTDDLLAVNVTEDADLTDKDLSDADSLSIGAGFTATVTATQADAFAGNVTKGAGSLLAVSVTTSEDLTGKDLSDADSLAIASDTDAITATVTAEQADALVGKVTTGTDDQLKISVTETEDLSALDLSEADALAIDDSNSSNAITATISATQADTLVGDEVTVTKGTDDLLVVGVTETATGDLTALDLSLADRLAIDDDNDSSVVTATVTATQADTFAGKVDKGEDDLLQVNVTADEDLTAKDLSDADAVVIDEGADGAQITATVTAAQADWLAGDDVTLTKGGTGATADLLKVSVTGNEDLTAKDLTQADQLDIASDTSAITATVTATQADDFAGAVTKGTDDELKVSVTASEDLAGVDLSDADSLVIDDGDNSNAITATMSAGEASLLVDNEVDVTIGADDFLQINVTTVGTNDLTGLDLSKANAIDIDDGNDASVVTATVTAEQADAFAENDVAVTIGDGDVLQVTVDAGDDGTNIKDLTELDLSEANALVVDGTAITAKVTAEQADAFAENEVDVTVGADDFLQVSVTADQDLTELDLSEANALEISSDSSAITATVTAEQADAFAAANGGTVSKGTDDLLEVSVTASEDLTAKDLTDVDTLSIDDGDNTNAITATVTAEQADALAESNDGTVTKGADDLLKVSVTADEDLTQLDLSEADQLDIASDTNAITAQVTATQADAFADADVTVTTGKDDLLQVSVAADENLTDKDLSKANALSVDGDDASGTAVTATVTAAQADALAENEVTVTKGTDDLLQVSVTADQDLTTFDLSEANALSIDDGAATAITATVTAEQADHFATITNGIVAKGTADLLKVSVTGDEDLTGLDFSLANTLYIDNGNDSIIAARVTTAQADLFATGGGTVTTTGNDWLIVELASGETDLTTLNLTGATHVDLKGVTTVLNAAQGSLTIIDTSSGGTGAYSIVDTVANLTSTWAGDTSGEASSVTALADSADISATTLHSDVTQIDLNSQAVLTLTAAQATGHTLTNVGTTALTISDTTIAADTDLSGIGVDDVTISGTVDDGVTLTMTVAQATGETIGVTTTPGSTAALVISDATIGADTDLSNIEIEDVTVGTVDDGFTLTMTAAQADGNAIAPTGTTGALVISGTAISADLDLSSSTITDVTLPGTVDTNVTLTLTAAQADGLSIAGAGDVVITGLDGTAAYDFSGITSSGGVSADVATNTTLDAGTDLGSAVVTLGNNVTLSLEATQADGATIGEATGDDSTVTITGLADTDNIDLANITTNAEIIQLDATNYTNTADPAVIGGLEVGDMIDTGEGDALIVDDNTANVTTTGGTSDTVVDAANEWTFDDTADLLTWYDGTSAAITMTLTGVASVTTDGASDVFVVSALG